MPGKKTYSKVRGGEGWERAEEVEGGTRVFWWFEARGEGEGCARSGGVAEKGW